jgi:hypothetical protein
VKLCMTIHNAELCVEVDEQNAEHTLLSYIWNIEICDSHRFPSNILKFKGVTAQKHDCFALKLMLTIYTASVRVTISQSLVKHV